MRLPPSHTDPELLVAIEKAKEKFAAMSPEEQAAMRKEQRRSWVRGELMLQYENMTVDEANALIDTVGD